MVKVYRSANICIAPYAMYVAQLIVIITNNKNIYCLYFHVKGIFSLCAFHIPSPRSDHKIPTLMYLILEFDKQYYFFL